MKKLNLRAFVLPVALVVLGCKNTAHGVCKDIEKAGEKIQDKTE